MNAHGRVSPLAMSEDLDPLEDDLASDAAGWSGLAVDEFPFERGHEALSQGMVATDPSPTH